jgi:hypothetical protein
MEGNRPMSEPTSNLPPPIPTASAIKPKSRWRGLKITAGIVLGVILIFKIVSSSGSVELELTRKYSDGKVVEIINVGGTPIKITKVTINDRDDCKIRLFDLLKDSNGVPADLKVGDKLELWSTSCRIVRANVETDEGSRTYTFSGS